MTIKIISEQFNIFNNPELDYYDPNLSVDTNNDIPKIQVRFYVKKAYLSETVNGEFQFSKHVHQQFNTVKTLFCKEYGALYDKPNNKYNSLEFTTAAVNALKEKLETFLLIPGEIELSSIELLGNWEVYNGTKHSALANEFEKNMLADLNKQLQLTNFSI